MVKKLIVLAAALMFLGPTLGLVGVALAGYLGTRRVLSHPPMESLRAG